MEFVLDERICSQVKQCDDRLGLSCLGGEVDRGRAFSVTSSAEGAALIGIGVDPGAQLDQQPYRAKRSPRQLPVGGSSPGSRPSLPRRDRRGQLGARPDAQLAIDPREVELDRLRAQEQLGGDLTTRRPARHSQRHPNLLGREIVGIGGAPPPRAGGSQLRRGARGPRRRSEPVEHVEGGPQLLARLWRVGARGAGARRRPEVLRPTSNRAPE